MFALDSNYMKDEIPDEIEAGNIYLVKSRDIHPEYGVMFVAQCEVIIHNTNGYEYYDIDELEQNYIIIRELNPKKVTLKVTY